MENERYNSQLRHMTSHAEATLVVEKDFIKKLALQIAKIRADYYCVNY